ncbi:hypothetical protein F442_12955 [Phytophthora nicotianae P10297]|uniref:FAS1 domain-containing protein n=1 Tax=Phytophthora nicotianae P10297 TaxID=1317064 RepID=W2YX34_PHYNI|nr:hypothetical protein F442_12955 [Phytophthora nicotianae P10297]
MVASTTCFSVMLATAMLAANVYAHGYMSDPAVTFLTTNDPTQFIATIESSASGLTGTFNGAPADNTAAFTKAFESSSFSSLKELINEKATLTVSDATLTCGSCDPDETAQPLPDTYVEWAHSDSEGLPLPMKARARSGAMMCVFSRVTTAQPTTPPLRLSCRTTTTRVLVAAYSPSTGLRCTRQPGRCM